MQHLVHDGGGVAGKRLLTGQKLVQDHATRKNVAAPVDRLPHKLLGRHVGRRAHDGSYLCQLRLFNARDAKVGNLDLAVSQHNQVGGLHVAVHYAVGVGVGQRIEYFAHQALDVFQRKPLVGLKKFTQLFAFDKLHGNKGHALARLVCRRTGHHGVVFVDHGFAIVINRHNAGVV